MPTLTEKGYVVRTQAEAPTVPCPCGDSTRIITSADGRGCSLHVTSIKDAQTHYHKKTAEMYYILEGHGKMELNGDWIDVAPGTVVVIDPGTRHRLISDEGVKTIVVGMPAFDPDDEYFD